MPHPSPLSAARLATPALMTNAPPIVTKPTKLRASLGANPGSSSSGTFHT